MSTNIYDFLNIHGVIQDPETKEYIIVMQYANSGSLLFYLDQNINELTWKMKLRHLKSIVNKLSIIHNTGLVHCNLHGGNILMHDSDESDLNSFICDLSLSRSVYPHHNQQNSAILRGVLPFIAPEVFHTHKFTQKSDIYSFGIIMHLMATGEPPFYI